MASQISFESFKRLLEDDVFVDYLNKFCSLPVFGQRIVYRKSLSKCICEPELVENIVHLDVLKWVWETRLSFFFRSHIYAEYKLAKALIEYDLNEDGGVEHGLARGMAVLQYHSFSKMSRFSKFCKFLSETGEGLRLVAFFIAAQHVFVAYYESDPDTAIHIGELRDKFFDETSYWCLPKKVLENFARSDQSTSVAFCMTVSQRVLSRICLYWLPRYLLHLRLNSMDSNEAPTIDKTRQYLHDLIFRVQDMDPEAARKSVSGHGLLLLADSQNTGARKKSNLEDSRKSALIATANAEDMSKSSFADMFNTKSNQGIEQLDRRMTNIAPSKRANQSIAIPGCEIKVERKKSKRPTMLQLSSAISFGIQLATGNELLRNKTETPTDKNVRLTNMRQTRRVNKESRMESRIDQSNRLRENTMSKSTMRKASGLRSVQSVSGLTNRMQSVTKAVSKFKLARESHTATVGTPKDKAAASSADLFQRPVKSNRPRIPNKDDNKPIKEQSKNVIKFKTADMLNDKYEPAGEVEKVEEKSETKVSLAQSVPKISVAEDTRQSGTAPAPPTKFGTLIQARSIALKWKKGKFSKKPSSENLEVSGPAKTSGLTKDVADGKKDLSKPSKITVAKSKKTDTPKIVEPVDKAHDKNASGLKNATGLKMVFAMSDQREDQREDDQKTIKVLTKKDNRLNEEVITENQDEEENKTIDALPETYLRNRRNAMSKIKPLKTLRKRPHIQTLTATTEKPEQKRTVEKQTRKEVRSNSKDKDNEKGSPFQTKQLGQRKADFIKKALMVDTLQERIKAPDVKDDNIAEFGDSYSSSVYSLHEDQVYRHEMRHLRAALRSDDFAAGPFMTYLTEAQNDEAAMFALSFWQEVERFREEFSGMQQSDLILTMDQIFTKYVLNDRGFQFIPGMQEYTAQVIEIDIFSCLTFPWPLRLLQRKCMETLNNHWEEYIICDTESFYDGINMLTEAQDRITIEAVAGLIKSAFEEEVPPSFPHSVTESSNIKKEVSKSRVSRKSVRPSRLTTPDGAYHRKSMTFRPTIDSGPRTTLGYLPFQMHGQHRSALQATAMARRSYRSYLLAEHTCRLTAKIDQTDKFYCDESDDEGFIKPNAPPVYLRTPEIDMKTLSLLSAKEYPSKNPLVRKTTMRRNTEKAKSPSYMKETIRKNGVMLKRPMMRPKHLVDCLRDPIHLEFFRRFAKTYNFERSVRFWKAIEVMKHIDDPKFRQAKIRGTINQFFAKGAATGVGVDGQVLREIMRTPPDKVTVSMLISAQACVMKALEDQWGERYLSTFTDVKKTHAQKERMDRTEIMKMAQSNGKSSSIWRVFYAFIKRSAKFVSTMKNRELRHEFELYLQTVGRDPTVYQKEGWSEINASSYDIHMNPDVVFHQKKQQGRYVISELLINDFRFWCEIECYRSQAEHVQQNGDNGMYDAVDEEILHDKAKLICDQFLSSPIPPKCRINIQSELSSTVIENVKLGMFNRSLFHDLTINIFPLLLNYWKTFCDRRHQYVSRAELHRFKHELVLQRRINQDKPKKSKEITKQISGDGPLIDYCSNKRFTGEWMDTYKTVDETPSMYFSLSSGVKLTVPIKTNTGAIPKVYSGENSIRSKIGRK